LAVAAVSEGELLFGLRKKGSRRLWLEYEEFLRGKLLLLPYGEAEAREFAEIKADLVRRGIPKGDADIQIAATAQTNGLIVATLNGKDFEPMAGVAAEDWSRVLS